MLGLPIRMSRWLLYDSTPSPSSPSSSDGDCGQTTAFEPSPSTEVIESWSGGSQLKSIKTNRETRTCFDHLPFLFVLFTIGRLAVHEISSPRYPIEANESRVLSKDNAVRDEAARSDDAALADPHT